MKPVRITRSMSGFGEARTAFGAGSLDREAKDLEPTPGELSSANTHFLSHS
jgi:hypothetical protein